MILTRKIRIYPDKDVQGSLWFISRLCAGLWNLALEQRQRNPSLTLYTQKKILPHLKKEQPELKKPSSQVLQNVFFSLDQAIKMCKTKRKKGDTKAQFPHFKNQNRFFSQEYSQKDVSFKFEHTESGTFLKLAYGSRPKDWLSIEIPYGSYDKIKTVTIIYKDKKWYACITYTVDLPELKAEGHVLYFDPGCKTALTGIKTTKEFYEYDLGPLREINKETSTKIDLLKSKRALKKKGSYHYRRLTKQIEALYSKIATRTKAYLHTLANRILDDHPDVRVFSIGNWSKKDTLSDTGNSYKDRKINRAVQNNHPLEKLIGYLTYKGRLRGQELERFDERGSTRTCAACDYVHQKGISPAVRLFKCERCTFTYPRDHHSCLNFVKKKEAALWLCLSGSLPDRSRRLGLHPFLFKPRLSFSALAAS
jgi:putative transposase